MNDLAPGRKSSIGNRSVRYTPQPHNPAWRPPEIYNDPKYTPHPFKEYTFGHPQVFAATAARTKKLFTEQNLTPDNLAYGDADRIYNQDNAAAPLPPAPVPITRYTGQASRWQTGIPHTTLTQEFNGRVPPRNSSVNQAQAMQQAYRRHIARATQPMNIAQPPAPQPNWYRDTINGRAQYLLLTDAMDVANTNVFSQPTTMNAPYIPSLIRDGSLIYPNTTDLLGSRMYDTTGAYNAPLNANDFLQDDLSRPDTHMIIDEEFPAPELDVDPYYTPSRHQRVRDSHPNRAGLGPILHDPTFKPVNRPPPRWTRGPDDGDGTPQGGENKKKKKVRHANIS